VAEDPESREIVGYARSIARGGLLELTEFFVRPGRQSAGVGRSLIERAFPEERGDVRSIIATGDVRALARYYAAGTVIRFPILNVGRDPQTAPVEGLTASRLDDQSSLEEVMEIERTVVGFGRDDDELRWLLGTREGYLYRRGDTAVGFGFVGRDASGPIAAVDLDDLPEMLLHVEDRAAALGVAHLEFEVPAVNAIAIRHLLGRGFKLNPWINYLMSDRPFGQFDRYVCFSPPIFL
jgi:predicted acetyltransferase